MLGPSVQYEFVDISMESMVGQIEQLVHSLPIIVDVLALVSEFVVVAVFPCENASSARVQQITRLFFAVTRDQTGNDCLCRFYMVGSIGGIWCHVVRITYQGMWPSTYFGERGVRSTISAAALSLSSKLESSRSPITMRMEGYLALTCSAFSALRIRAE